MFAQLEVGKALANTVFVSIPEEIFLIGFCLFLLNRFDVAEMSKAYNKVVINWKGVWRFLIPVTISALLSNILRYSNIDKNVMLLIGIPAVALPIIITYKIWNIKEIIKTFIFAMVSFLILMISEFIYVPLTLYFTNNELSEINKYILLNFIWSLPSRLLQYCILSYFTAKRFNFLNINVIKVIMRSKLLILVAISTLVFNVMLLIIAYKLVCVNKVLVNSPLFVEVIVNVAIMAVPILDTFALWAIIYNIKNKELFEIKLIRDRLSALADALAYFYAKGQHDKVKMAIDDIKNNIEKMGDIP